MVNNEKEFARLPGARIINRYMPRVSLEEREKARTNLNDLLVTLLEIEERRMRDERKRSDVEPHG